MEDAYYYGKSQRLVSDMGSPTPQTQPNPCKFYWHFLCKAVFVTSLLVILPLFPSQPPEFVTHSVLTRNWELFHLLFVGIAVSYGLFSRRNVEMEKENQPKIDSAQNYVSRIFQVSSVFDDDVDSPSGFDDNSKVQTWNSRYFRGEPMLVVEQESSVPDEQSHIVTKISNKPLHLPVRSLKSRISDSEDLESSKEPRVFSGSLTRSSSGSRSSSNGSVKTRNGETGAVDPPLFPVRCLKSRVSNSEDLEFTKESRVFSGSLSSGSRSSSNGSVRSRNGEIGDVDPLDLEERLQENVVLPSPIPWRSRSGRMEMKEELEVVSPHSLPPSADEAEIERDRLHSRSFRLPMSWSSQPNSTSPSPEKLSPSPSLSPELRAKNMEDSVRKKSYYTSSTPPTPLPPPVSHKSPLITSNPSPVSNGYSSQNMGMDKSFKDELKDLRSSREGVRRRSDPGVDTLRSEVKSAARTEGISMAKSVRTFRTSEPIAEGRKTRECNGEQMLEKTGKRSNEVEAMFMETTGRRAGGFTQLPINNEKPGKKSKEVEAMFMETTGRRAGGFKQLPINNEKPGKKSKEVEAMFMETTGRRAGGFEQLPINNGKPGKKSKEIEAMFMETTGRRAGGFEQLPINNEKSGQESPRQMPESPLSKYPMEEKKEFSDKVIIEKDEDSDSEAEADADADETQGNSDKEEAASDTVTDAVVDTEVDKKAAEFIAKFKEQIRLQRIASIKRASGKVSGKTSSR
ncbi:serine/arginine repetitive matrix protein 1-like [Macadamia integrifolia]|uniref:serine/arginine repetitive matrix protein 1-like n=1 Tax=Macadamia integrifolia TaxID=60698 RepID=UPI001C5012C0|nr:serine/arginine repetitive matrix protein 1-like [Macadamia integrifolia]